MRRGAVPQVSELKFVVNDEARQVAWKLYVETVAAQTTAPWRRDRRVGTPGPSSSAKYGTRPAMLITSARVDPVTRRPVPVANGPSSARSRRSATGGWLAHGELRRAQEPATGVSASTPGV